MTKIRGTGYQLRRKMILEECAKLFAKTGYDAVSVGEMTVACGISKGLLYHYYSSKEAILFELMSSHVAVLQRDVAAVMASGQDPPTRCRELVHRLTRHSIENAASQKVLLNDLRRLPEDKRAVIVAKQRDLVGSVQRVLSDLYPLMARNPAGAMVETMLLFGMINWTHTWFDPGGALSAGDIAEQVFECMERAASLPAREDANHKERGNMRMQIDRTRAPLDPIETASRDELTDLQTRRLRWTLGHAYDNVEHFRKKCAATGVTPDDFRELKDLALFPFTTKEDFRQTYPFGMTAVKQDEIVRLHGSSGTTGKPIVVAYTAEDISIWADLVARSIRAAGGARGDKVHIAYGYGLFTGGLGAHYGAERLGCTVIPMSGGQTERQVQLIRDFQPTIIMVTPSYMLNLAEEMERQGMAPNETSLRLGIFGAEPWTEAMRIEMERRLGIDAVDIYGLSEVMGPGVACECLETKDGPTIWEDHFYPEIIDPVTGKVLPDGSPGELVFTTLSKRALPVIRYRTRDLTTLLPPTARSMRRMAKITGRSDDMLIIRGVNLFPTQIEELICRVPGLSPHFELVVTRQGNLDHLAIRVERSPSGGPDNGDDLQHLVKSYVGVSSVIELVDPGSVERSTGKVRRVRDERPR